MSKKDDYNKLLKRKEWQYYFLNVWGSSGCRDAKRCSKLNVGDRTQYDQRVKRRHKRKWNAFYKKHPHC